MYVSKLSSFLFLDDCGNNWSKDKFSLEIISNENDNLYASGFKGLLLYAFMPLKSNVKSFKWTVKQENKNTEFSFTSWSYKEKRSDLFKVDNTVNDGQNFIFSYFNLIEKAFLNTTFDLEFSMNDYTTSKSCTINDFTFSGKNHNINKALLLIGNTLFKLFKNIF